MEVAKEQAIMDFVADSEASTKGKTSGMSYQDIKPVARQLECCRDEVRCRELMAGAHPKVKAALRNLKQLLKQERKSLT